MAMAQTTLSPGTYDKVHAQVEILAHALDPHDYLSGTWLRELVFPTDHQGRGRCR
jgi:hypothetical protein